MPHRLNMILLSGAAALALAGCREDAPSAPEPLFVPASTSLAYDVPPPGEVVTDPAQPLVRADYSYAERAYALDRAFYDAPPDYGFSYAEADPWAWRSMDGYEMYAEPIDDGYLYYYYEPGADYPFFVRSPHYSYGYDPGGIVTVVYSSSGVIVPYAYRDRRFDYADRYWKRARDLRVAAYRHHEPIVRETWIQRRPAFIASQRTWMKAAVERPEWRRYRERDRDREIRRFDKERERRVEIARRFGHGDARPVRVRDDDDRRPAFLGPRSEPPRRDQRDDRPRGFERREPRPDVQRARIEQRQEHPSRRPRAEQPDRSARAERIAKVEPVRREPRSERMERGKPRPEHRAERPVRPDREARPERAARGEAARRDMPRPERAERGTPRQEHRAERPDRSERQVREARLTRADRPERGAPERRPDRVERPSAQQAARQERQPRQVARQERAPRPEQAQGARHGGGDRQQPRAERREGGGKPDRPERGRKD